MDSLLALNKHLLIASLAFCNGVGVVRLIITGSHRFIAIAMLATGIIAAVFAQTQSTLREKYGPPDPKGRYTVRPGIGVEPTYDAD